MPKSSTDRRTPRLFSLVMRATTASGSCIIAVSVTSSTSRTGSSPLAASALATSGTIPVDSSWRAEMLTATSRQAPSCCQPAAVWQASERTYRPRSTMSRPDASARGMNFARWEQAPFRVLPAHERLHAADVVVLQVEDRLIVEAQLAFVDR